MPRPYRIDHPGAWHHVYNRGIARRTLFPSRGDVRYFLACVARAVRRGEIEVHSYCVMTTHYHLLVRSVAGELSAAMQRIQDAYSRRLNRRLGRDGPLVRSRFGSRLVVDGAHLECLIRYVHLNPVVAEMVESAVAYPHSSARAVRRAVGPPWLSLGVVRGVLDEYRRPDEPPELAFDRYVSAVDAEIVADLVERAPAPHGALAERAEPSARVRAWMEARALLADRMPVAPRLVSARSVLAALAESAPTAPPAWRRRGPVVPTIAAARAGMLIASCRISHKEAAARLREPRAAVRNRADVHVRRLAADPEYADWVAGVLRSASAADCGGGVTRAAQLAAASPDPEMWSLACARVPSSPRTSRT